MIIGVTNSKLTKHYALMCKVSPEIAMLLGFLLIIITSCSACSNSWQNAPPGTICVGMPLAKAQAILEKYGALKGPIGSPLFPISAKLGVEQANLPYTLRDGTWLMIFAEKVPPGEFNIVQLNFDSTIYHPNTYHYLNIKKVQKVDVKAHIGNVKIDRRFLLEFSGFAKEASSVVLNYRVEKEEIMVINRVVDSAEGLEAIEDWMRANWYKVVPPNACEVTLPRFCDVTIYRKSGDGGTQKVGYLFYGKGLETLDQVFEKWGRIVTEKEIRKLDKE